MAVPKGSLTGKKSIPFNSSGTKTLKWVYYGGSGVQNSGWVDGLVIGDGVLVPQPDGYYSEALDSNLKFTSSGTDISDTWYADSGSTVSLDVR